MSKPGLKVSAQQVWIGECSLNCKHFIVRTEFSPTSDRVFHLFLVKFIMLSFPSCLYLPRERQLRLSKHLVRLRDVLINISWHRFLTRKRFEVTVVFESNKRDFVIEMESGRRKIINHYYVKGQGNPPSCQRFATSMTRQASSWTANL